MSGLYDGIEYFSLFFDKEHDIKEPQDWDKIRISCPRDKDWYGFISEFVEGDIQLTFPDNEGGALISDWLEENGPDINIYFEFGVITSEGRQILYRGRLNVGDQDGNKADGFTCPIERTDFENTLRTRYDAKVNMLSTKDLEDNTISALTPMSLQLHSKEIIKSWQADFDATVSTQYADLEDTATTWGTTWLQPDTQNITVDELKNNFSLPFSLRNTNPFSVLDFIYEAIEAGILNVDFKAFGTAYIDSSKILSADIILQVERGASIIQTLTHVLNFAFVTVTKPDGTTAPNWISGHTYNAGDITRDGDALFRCKFNGTATSTAPHLDAANWEHTPYYSVNTFDTTGVYVPFALPVLVADRIYLNIRLNHNTIGGTTFTISPDIKVDGYQNSIIFKQYTSAPKSICKAHRLFDVINQCVYAMTGLANRVISDYYGTGGPAEKRALLNGYQVREFDVSKRPLQIDLKTILESLQAIDNIGVGYRTVDGLDYLVIEPMMYFFRKRIIATITGVFDYKNKTRKQYIYNQFTGGFEQYAQNEFNSIDDYMTEQSHLMPVKNIAQALNKRSKLIGSPYLIENHRREQYKTNPSTALKQDEDTFIVCYTDKVIYKDIYYAPFNSVNEIWFSVDVGLVPGDTITLKDNVYNNNVSFVVSARIYSSGGYGWTFTTAPTNVPGGQETCTLEITPPAGAVVAERNEQFEVVEGTISPATIYNGRITPKHNFYNWGPLLNIGSNYKDNATKIINTNSKVNGEFTTKFRSTTDNPGYVGTQTIKENENVTISNYSNRKIPFLPFGPDFKAQLDKETIDTIRKALRGELGDENKDHGCLLVQDDKGVFWYMAVLKMDYEPESQTGIFECAKIEKY